MCLLTVPNFCKYHITVSTIVSFNSVSYLSSSDQAECTCFQSERVETIYECSDVGTLYFWKLDLLMCKAEYINFIIIYSFHVYSRL